MSNFIKLTAITPAHIPSTEDYLRAIKKGVDKTAALVLRDLQSTTRTWEHKPVFDVTVTNTGGNYSVAAGTDDQKYGWVDAGTKPHIIRPRYAPFLHFAYGGRAKTRPGIIGSQAGTQGTNWVNASYVLHPGTEKRQFIFKITKRRQVTMTQEVSDALADVAKQQR